MEFSLSVSSAGVSGGNLTFSLAGMYLQDGLGEYGAAVAEIEATACFRGGRVRNPSLKDLFERYHAEFLPSLPYLKFLRKKKRVLLSYETAVADAKFLGRSGGPFAAVFTPALAELADKLRLIDARFKKSDDFDLARFHADVARLVAAAPRSDEALAALREQLVERLKRRHAAMDWWDRVGIDWDDYHPDARKLLDDEFFWDCTDDWAPHGNDTGADLLSDFEKWNRSHPQAAAHEMAEGLLEGWEVGRIDLDAADEATVRSLLAGNPIALEVNNEAMIAVAFAAVKHRGWCDARTRELALRAIERQRIGLRAMNGARDVAEEEGKLNRLVEALGRVPGRANDE